MRNKCVCKCPIVIRVILIVFVSTVLASCASLDELLPLESEKKSQTLTSVGISGTENNFRNFNRQPVQQYNSHSKRQKVQFFPGTDRLTGSPKDKRTQTALVSSEGVTLNLVNANISQAAKAILADVLKVNYTVDEQVSGQVTIQTSSPIHPDGLLGIFEAVLSSKGAAIIEANGLYKIVPLSSVRKKILPIKSSLAKVRKPGIKAQIVSLRYVAASEMERVLGAIIPQEAILRVDRKRNLLVLLGTDTELAMIGDAIDLFDIDIMKGKSFALLPLERADPEAAAKELTTIFESESGGSLEGVVRFIPNRRLNAVLVIAHRTVYLKRAQKWLARLDKTTKQKERRLYVYSIQNRPASELAKILNGVFEGAAITASTENSVVAPRLEPVENRTDGSNYPANPIPSRKGDALRRNGFGRNGIRFIVDEANNALLIMATSAEYKRISRVLLRVDVLPNQVLLEATIAEVSLNDELQFGLRWFFQQKNNSVTFSDLVTGAVASSFPGFSYFLSGSKLSVSLNALASITNVKVISSPSLMVLDNKTAVLQVGDQVPVVVQSSTSVISANAPVVNTVELRDTGIILSITPRISDSGRVILNIEQEVSNVVQTTTSGIDSPTIQQRKIKTTVAVDDGESLTLGGLIQERKNLNRGQVPLLGDIPIFGNLFKNKTNRIERTELLIIIRPQVIRNLQEARSVTDEFKRRLNLDFRSRRRGPPTTRENIRRVLGQ